MKKVNNFKKYIIVVAIILIYVLCVYIYVSYNNKTKEKKVQMDYLVTKNSNYIISNTNEWQIENDINIFNWKNYNIYIDNKYLGQYNLQYNKKWYIFNDKRESIKYEGKMIAYSGNNIKIKEYNVTDIDDSDKIIIDKYLINNGIDLVQYKTINAKYKINIDNDEEEEIIYEVNSIIENNKENKFSIVLLYDQNKLSEIASNVTKKDSMSNIILYKIYGFIDIEQDNDIDIIINRMKYSQPDSDCDIIKKNQSNSFESFITSCSM